jgi:alditol oxidase
MRNWAGNLAYAARAIHEPESLEELQQLVRDTPRIRALGTRHSFSSVADTSGDLVSVARMPRRFEVDAANRRVTIDAATRYGELAPALDAAGFALANLASLPHISVAGSIATGTHGSGVRLGSLASEAVGLELVVGGGEHVSLTRDADRDRFPGTVVALGALGVVTAVTLAVQPAYRTRQDVFDDLPFHAALESLDELLAAGDAVSLFTTWRGPAIEQVWVKRRVVADPAPLPAVFTAARPAAEPRHPIPGFSTDATTEQLGVPGPWYERLPHFRLDHTPSAGEELQAEWILPREHGADALRAVHAIRDRVGPLIQTSEIRTIAASDLWLDPAYGRDSLAVHFTLVPDGPAVAALLPLVDAALAPFEPRPHWGKLSTLDPATIVARFPRFGDFARLRTALDPQGTFRNPFVDDLLAAHG